MVDFEWYRSFLAVYRVGTVSGAARTLFLTQPAVTQHLAALETAVGEALFVRTARQMIPTQRGKALYNQIAPSLERLEQVSQELQGSQSDVPLLRLGTPIEYFSMFGLDRLATLFNDYHVWVQFDEARTLIESLERDELDVVIATQRIAARTIDYSKLEDEQFQLVGPLSLALPDTPDQKEEKSAIAQWLTTQTWISYGVNLPIIRRFWQQCFQQRPEFQPHIVLPNLTLIEQAVERGLGISVLPAYLCREAIEAERLHIIWQPAQPVENELWFAYHKGDRNSKIIKSIHAAFNK